MEIFQTLVHINENQRVVDFQKKKKFRKYSNSFDKCRDKFVLKKIELF